MNSSGSTPASRRLHSRVAFVPNTGDLYGAINCADDGTSNFNNDPVASNNSKDVSKISNRLKPGPPLLEIRKINYSTFDEQEESQPQSSWSPFQHETILVSRGIPGSVSSTCLDFAKSSSQTIRCATGLTSGALAVHSISNILAYSLNSNIGDESNLDLPTSTVTHYAPRQQRPSSCVAWHPAALGANSKNGLVAIGLVGSAPPPGNTNSISKAATARGLPVGSASSLTSGSSISTTGIGGSTTMGGSTDRDFGCLVWDIEAQSSSVSGAGTVRGKSAAVKGRGSPPPAKGKGSVPIKSPLYRFANNNGVESLSWLMDGQLLAVGCQKRALQLYDLRMSGTNAPPISVFAHTDAVSGIMPDDCCPTKTVFATFGRNVGEPVKIWDARMMDSTLGEIRVPSPVSNIRGEGNTFPQYGGGVTAMAWSDESPGELAIAIGDSIRTYQTRLPGSRALPVNVSYVDSGDTLNSIQCLAFQPRPKNTTKKQVGFYPHRLLTVSSRGEVSVVPNSHVAPLAISKRDGRIAHGLGDTVWIGATTEGPSAMEGELAFTKEDVSARMMRRARCLHDVRYSTDAMNNVMLLEEEQQQLYAQRHAQLSQEKSQISTRDSSEDFQFASSNIDQLLNSWRWICRIEYLTSEKGEENSDEFLPAKGLIDAGVMKLLRMSSREATHDGNSEDKSKSDTLFCEVYDSPSRRAAMCACGWIKKYGSLRDLLDQFESSGEFERSAALAVWHGDLGECVAALQRGAEDVKTLVDRTKDDGDASDKKHGRTTTESYAETLSLIAMCVAGYGSIRTSHIWSNACESLLRRPDVSEANISNRSNGAVYLRAILLFLQNIGDGLFECITHYDKILLADRVAFACKFLPRAELRSFLDASIRKCLQYGDLEGLVITGLDKRGIALLQSYVDRQSDVQTAALISSRIILPNEWNLERKVCHEWLESYRLLLNNLQMFHSRAAFDVGRCEHIRQLKEGGIFSSLSASGRRITAKKQDNKVSQPNFPPQLWARCNYCNASLPLSKLRRQEGIANSWLSRQNPVLQCCPQCKKPLPRCSICLLSLGCLNPYMELQRERNQFPRNAMSADKKAMVDDLSGLASIPFAEWFTWCMRCKHGGHAHHLVGWFSKHETCAVSGCDCKCQFDGIEKLRRPGLR